MIRNAYLYQKKSKSPFVFKNQRIAICGWELSHNAAGRMVTIAEMYQYSGYSSITMIGCILQNKKKTKKLWQPLNNHTIPCKYFKIQQERSDLLLKKAIRFVITHPFDIVHLSKPRITNIVIGLLYKIIWQAKVIMDIDDEELGFTPSQQARTNGSVTVRDLLILIEQDKHILINLRDEFWTQISVSLYAVFDEIIVSNPALQLRYGGKILPHVRDETKFLPSAVLTPMNRKKYGIAQDAIVVLFFGTAKRHKGLLETANSLAKVNHPNVIFLIVGDFVDLSLKQELIAIKNVRYHFLPNQPYQNARDIVALGDICILLQDIDNEISRYQLPAKLIDALAMGLKVFLQSTPATQNIVDSGWVQAVTEDNLACHLIKFLSKYSMIEADKIKQHYYFVKYFSMHAYEPLIHQLVIDAQPQTPTFKQQYQAIKKIHSLTLLEFLHYSLSKYAHESETSSF